MNLKVKASRYEKFKSKVETVEKIAKRPNERSNQVC